MASAEKEIKEIKTLISSLLISTPSKSTILSLDREFKQEIGYPIPFQKFGHPSLDSFLRSMPDTLTVLGWGPNAPLQVHVSSKAAHIDDLISKQKSNRRKTVTTRSSRFYNNFTRPAPQPVHVDQRPAYLLPLPLFPSLQSAYQVGYGVLSPSYLTPRPPYESLRPTYGASNTSYGASNTSYGASNGTPQQYIGKPDGTSQQYIGKPDGTPQQYIGKPDATPQQYIGKPDGTSQQYIGKPDGTPQQYIGKPHGFPTATPVQNISPPNLTHTPHNSSNSFSGSSSGSAKGPTLQRTPLALKSDKTQENKQYSGPFLKFYESEGSSSNTSRQDRASNLKKLKQPVSGALTSTSNFKVPHDVQDNLLRLVQDHPNGIDCSIVPSLYRKKYKSELNYLKYGYRNLIQLIKDFPDTYHCFRPDYGDYKVFDKSQPLPDDLDSLNNTVEEECGTSFARSETKSRMFSNFALPEDLYNSLDIEYPQDVVKIKELIPRHFISESTKKYDEIKLHVGEVYDPSKFWIILDDGYNDLDNLMCEMQALFSFQYDKLKIDEQHLEVGMFCASIFQSQFHRAILTKIKIGEHRATVFYCDYGTVATVESSDLYFLPNKFSYLPQQAIRARLAGIIPPTNQEPWEIKTTLKFLNLVQGRPLIGKIYKIDREEQVIDVVLMEMTDKNCNINDALVKEKLAIFDDQVPNPRLFTSVYIPSVVPIHYYPTFHELENCLVSSLPEFTAKTQLGLRHDEIYPEYYEVFDVKSSSISGPAIRRQHLKEIYSNSNEIDGKTLPRIVKPPPGFEGFQPNLSFDLPEITEPIVSNDSIAKVPLIVPPVDILCTNMVSTPPLLKDKKPRDIIVNRRKIAQAIMTVIKAGNVYILYLLEDSLKRFLVTSDVTDNLIKYLKNKYLKVTFDVMYEMITDILNHFNDLQLLNTCEFIKETVDEFELPQNESINPPLSESSSLSLHSTQSEPLKNVLSPLATSFVPALANHLLFPPILQSPPIMPPTPVPILEDQKSLSICSHDSIFSEVSLFSNAISSSSPSLPIKTPSLPESPNLKCEDLNLSSVYNQDDSLSESSLYISSASSPQLKNKFVFKKKLHGNVLTLINLNGEIYITITEMKEVSKLKDTNLETIKKNINMCDGAQYMHDIYLGEYEELEEELRRSGLVYDDDILSLMRIEFYPEFFKLFGDVIFPQQSFNKFLSELYNSDD